MMHDVTQCLMSIWDNFKKGMVDISYAKGTETQELMLHFITLLFELLGVEDGNRDSMVKSEDALIMEFQPGAQKPTMYALNSDETVVLMNCGYGQICDHPGFSFLQEDMADRH